MQVGNSFDPHAAYLLLPPPESFIQVVWSRQNIIIKNAILNINEVQRIFFVLPPGGRKQGTLLDLKG